MRLRNLVLAILVLTFSLAAHADTFYYSLDAGTSGFSNTGTLTGLTYGRAGGFFITAITGTGITGLICTPFSGFPPRTCAEPNDNIVYPLGIGYNLDPAQLLDTSGLTYTQQTGTGIDRINLFSSGTAYFATITDANRSVITIPVQFSLTTAPVATTPEPSSLALLTTGLLGIFGAARRRFA